MIWHTPYDQFRDEQNLTVVLDATRPVTELCDVRRTWIVLVSSCPHELSPTCMNLLRLSPTQTTTEESTEDASSEEFAKIYDETARKLPNRHPDIWQLLTPNKTFDHVSDQIEGSIPNIKDRCDQSKGSDSNNKDRLRSTGRFDR